MLTEHHKMTSLLERLIIMTPYLGSSKVGTLPTTACRRQNQPLKVQIAVADGSELFCGYFSQEERDSFSAGLLGDVGLVDTWRQQHPGVIGYTYYSYRFNMREKGKGWRLDYFLVCVICRESCGFGQLASPCCMHKLCMWCGCSEQSWHSSTAGLHVSALYKVVALKGSTAWVIVNAMTKWGGYLLLHQMAPTACHCHTTSCQQLLLLPSCDFGYSQGAVLVLGEVQGCSCDHQSLSCK